MAFYSGKHMDLPNIYEVSWGVNECPKKALFRGNLGPKNKPPGALGAPDGRTWDERWDKFTWCSAARTSLTSFGALDDLEGKPQTQYKDASRLSEKINYPSHYCR